MNCPQCGAPNETRDSFCADCGYSFATPMKIVQSSARSFSRDSPQRSTKPQQNNSKFLAVWLFSTVFIFLIIYLFFML